MTQFNFDNFIYKKCDKCFWESSVSVAVHSNGYPNRKHNIATKIFHDFVYFNRKCITSTNGTDLLREK